MSRGSEERRRIAFAACGLDPAAPVTRAPSYANETWIAEDVVVRVNFRGVGRLAREAAIVRRLPPEARHPGVTMVGDDGATEWSVSPRVHGRELGRAWRTMTEAQRERATKQLADALAAVHRTPCAGIPDDIEPPHTLPLAPLLSLVEQLRAKHGARAVLDGIAAFICTRWERAMDDRDRGLAHGDPHFENVLWDGAQVSLIDFEWSRPSVIHCDVEILLAVATTPALFASPDHEASVDAADYVHVKRWLREAQPAWFEHAALADRLDILHASRELGHLIDGDFPSRWDRLESILDGAPPYRRGI